MRGRNMGDFNVIYTRHIVVKMQAFYAIRPGDVIFFFSTGPLLPPPPSPSYVYTRINE